MQAQNSPIPPARKAKKSASIARYSDGPQPRATIFHDQIADAYKRGSADTARAIIIAAQAALAKRESQP